MTLRDQIQQYVDVACLVLGVTCAARGGSLAPLLCAAGPPLILRILWNDRTPMVFMFCMMNQWLYTSSAVFYASFVGYYPGFPRSFTNVTQTMLVIMTALICQSIGYYLGCRLTMGRVAPLQQSFPYNLNTLRVSAVLLSLGAAVVNIPPGSSGLRTFVAAFFAFRLVLLVLTVFGTLAQSPNWKEISATGLFVLLCTLLTFGSRQATFKEIILLSLIGAACAFRIRPLSAVERQTNRRIVVGLAATLSILLVAGMMWESQIKPIWRIKVLSSDPFERMADFWRLVATRSTEFEASGGLDALMKRMNNMWQTSLVIERVPKVIPHTHGQLTGMALQHVLVPRILFPNKATLAVTDRSLAERFAGIDVGNSTSVGIGYVMELYVDFGIPGVFIAALCLGIVLGIITQAFIRLSPSASLGLANALIAVWACFSGYEANLAKALGACLSFGAVFMILGWVFHRFASAQTPLTSAAISPIVVPRAATVPLSTMNR